MNYLNFINPETISILIVVKDVSFYTSQYNNQLSMDD